MSRGAGSADLRTTLRIASRLVIGSPGTACEADSRSSFDSARNAQAKRLASAHNAADARPGACGPHRLDRAEPSAGPAMAPRLVTAESQPSPLTRSSGRLESATYACTTPMVPPP